MKRINYLLLATALLSFTFLTAAAPSKSKIAQPSISLAGSTYIVDLKNSKISWNIKTSRGANSGDLKIKDGVIIEENNRVKSTVINMDMTAIIIRSIPPGIVNMKAVTILNTESFFDVARYPNSILEITRTVQKSDDTFEAIGFLTIKAKRQPIRFTMTGSFNYGHFEGTAKNIIVNRRLYDIRYTSGGDLGEKELEGKIEDAIDDNFTIDVFIVADKELKN